MTERDLTERWLNHIHFHFSKRGTRRDELAPIMPFIVLDIYYSYYNKGLQPENFRHEQKRQMRRASEAYNRLNQQFFACFSPDERDAVIDLMDSLEESAKTQITVAEVSAWNVFKHHKEADLLVNAFMCNLLAKAAQTIWEVVYRDQWGGVLPNKDINTILSATKAFAATIESVDATVDPKATETLLRAQDALGRKLVRWMEEDKEI